MNDNMNDNTSLAQIESTIHSHDVVLFMKGTKSLPQCGFSATVVNILERLNLEFRDVNVLSDMGLREGIKQFSSWPTIPQLYIKGEFIGGCDIAKEMYQSGELKELIASKGLASH